MISKMIKEKNKVESKEYNPKHTLLVDISNIFWVLRFSLLKSNEYDLHGSDLIFQNAFELLFDIKRKHEADNIVLAFDSPNTWRKQKFPEYKQGRKTYSDVYADEIREKLEEFYNFFNDYTNILCLKVDESEADDIIRVYVDYRKDDEQVTILSTDKDFIQLTERSYVFLFDPVKRKYREPENGIEEDLFIKCFRGDQGDNIKNIYPRIRTKNLLAAFNNNYEWTNLMETYNSELDSYVKDLYEQNKELIDLRYHPQEIQDRILDQIESKKYENKFDQVALKQELKRLDMEKLVSQLDKKFLDDLKNK